MEKHSEKFFYHIYPLGLCGAPEKNDENMAPVERLNVIYDWISHIKSLGANALYMGPIFESIEHGYDTVNYFSVDRRLGNNDTLKNLIKKLHENNIKVILDGVFNHVGREFFAFRDLRYHGHNSRYADWFSGVDFSRRSPYNDEFTYDTWAGHYNLVKLNHENYEVINHLIGAAQYWIDEFEIDGIRLDAADSLNFNFMEKFSREIKIKKPNFWLMGEVVHGNYARWVNEAGLDSVTNYECYKGLYSSHNDKNYFEIAYSLKRQFCASGMYKNISLYNFADNHDVERVATSIKNKRHLYPLYTILFTMPGIPSIYYGSEWELEGVKVKGSDKQLRPAININEIEYSFKKDMIRHISNLANIRNGSEILKYGTYEELFVKSEQFGFIREYNDEKIIVLLNSSANEENIKLNIHEGAYLDLLNNEEIYITKNNTVNIYPCWARILKKTL